MLTDIAIRNTSNHPYAKKISGFHSVLSTLVKVPLTIKNLNTELNSIK